MRTLLVAFIGGIVGTVFTSMIVLAWTGPTAAPPNGNVAAPINVGSTDQVKNAGLALNSLAVFGNAILSGTSRYLNFGSAAGGSGYGIRDNAGTMEFKNSSGGWGSFVATDVGTLCGLAYYSSVTSSATCSSAAYTSAATCKGVSVTSSCPAGYTLRTVTTGTYPNTFTGVIAYSCARTCSKN